MDIIIGLGEYAISNDTDDVLKTLALSSCVGLTAYDPIKKILGMVHIVLPDSEIAGDKLDERQAYYADTAVPLLIRKLCSAYGCIKEELEVRMFGGAESIRKDDIFSIGKRNVQMVESTLKKLGLSICYSDCGGNVSRSIAADVATGTVKAVCQPLNI